MASGQSQSRVLFFNRILVVVVLFVISTVDRLAIADNPPTPTQRLLNKLKLLNRVKVKNANDHRFDEAWLQTLKDVVDQGPDAVPDLIVELDQTADGMMRSCLGFLCRAIGDQRTVPSLIRAFPKTLADSYSEWIVRSSKPPLVEFARSNNADLRRGGKEIPLHRSAREIGTAIRKLTDYPWNESDNELFAIYFVEAAHQKRLKRELFQRTARTWAEWWERKWDSHVQDEAYSKVHLSLLEQESDIEPPSIEGHFRTGGGGFSNALLQPVESHDSRIVLFDLDVDRFGSVPKKWRDLKASDPNDESFLRWAADEGYDLIGSKVETADGHKIAALRSIGMQAWELKRERWKMTSEDLTIDSLMDEGIEENEILLHRNVETGEYDPKSPATFLVITRDGTVGLLFVGVEIRNDRQKLGFFVGGDNELKSSGPLKGRRFAFTELRPKEE